MALCVVPEGKNKYFVITTEGFGILIVFEQQWSSMTQRNKIYQTLDTHTILVSGINSLFLLVFS